MRTRKDSLTVDMFEIPQPVGVIPGSMNYAGSVSELVALVLKDSGLDRYEIAARMSRLSGDDVSKNMLDAWSSPARVDHNTPLYPVPLLERVTESHLFTDYLARLRGGRVAYGRDALNAELGRLERQRDEAAKKARELKRLLGESYE